MIPCPGGYSEKDHMDKRAPGNGLNNKMVSVLLEFYSQKLLTLNLKKCNNLHNRQTN